MGYVIQLRTQVEQKHTSSRRSGGGVALASSIGVCLTAGEAAHRFLAAGSATADDERYRYPEVY